MEGVSFNFPHNHFVSVVFGDMDARGYSCCFSENVYGDWSFVMGYSFNFFNFRTKK